MKFLYVANIRMPTERAHGVQIVKTVEAFVNSGAEVTLVVPDRVTSIRESVADYYGLKRDIPIMRLPVWDTVSWGFFGFALETMQFALQAARFARREKALVYGRDEVVLATIAFLASREIVWESHTGVWNMFARFVARRAKKLVVISNGLRDLYIAHGISREKIVVAHDGIDLASFDNLESRETARARLGIPQDAKVALYVGSLGSWKGTDTLLEASNLISDAEIVLIGAASDVLKARYPRVRFLGDKPYRDLPHNLQVADLLILPTSGKEQVGASFTSPLKLFAYMASGIPIIASDIPSHREVLAENAAFWCKPDDAPALAQAIESALSNPAASHIAEIAKTTVSLYTWEKRAEQIISNV